MFTKEHFEKVASVLSAARANENHKLLDIETSARSAGVRTPVEILIEAFADIFAESNERFSRKAFIGACRAVSRSEIRRLVTANNKRLAG